MKCLSCDVILSNEEATTKSPITDEYLDMCKACLHLIVSAFRPHSTVNMYDDVEYVKELLTNYIPYREV